MLYARGGLGARRQMAPADQLEGVRRKRQHFTWNPRLSKHEKVERIMPLGVLELTAVPISPREIMQRPSVVNRMNLSSD